MPGRGKPKGLPKSGGRQTGAVDKIKREGILAAQGITPLDYMMMLVRAETPAGLDPAIARTRETLRFEAAKAAAPYVHARLQAVTLGGDLENPIKLDNRSELDEARHLAFILSRAMKAKAE